jgi:site-specific DNA recombinase
MAAPKSKRGTQPESGVRRAALYPRVSTGKQEEEGTSLATQEQRCREYAASKGYVVVEEHVYREVHTGTELWERPQLAKMREAVRNREVDVVVAFAIDRLSRDPVHMGVIVSEAEHAGVAVEFVTEPLDNSPEGQLIRFVRGYAAKVEHEKIKERTIRGRRARAQSGKVHSHGVEKFGYRRNKEQGVRVVFEPEAAIVRDVFRWYTDPTEALPLRAIIRRLNERGTPSPGTGKLTYDDPDRVTRWGKGVLQRMLSDPAYKGEAVEWRFKRPGKTVEIRPESEWLRLPEGTVPAIVPPDVWEAAQARRATNKGQDGRNAARPYLLRGRIVCECGRPMRASPERGTRTYRCSSRETPAGACGRSRVPAEACEAWVWQQLCAVLSDPTIVAAELKRAQEQGPDHSLQADRDAAQRRLAKLDQQQERLLRRYREAEEDEFPWELVQREIAQIGTERKALAADLARIDAKLAEQQRSVDLLGALHTYVTTVDINLKAATFEDKRLALEALAVRVTGNGRAWRLDGSLPLDGAAGITSTTEGRCALPPPPPPAPAWRAPARARRPGPAPGPAAAAPPRAHRCTAQPAARH